MATPGQVSVTMYNVGFGDCFLLEFHYDDKSVRRILIDCGTSNAEKNHISSVVDKIAEDTEGHVDAVVATHRHKDHVSAFGLKGVGKKLSALEPEIVIQPWTEHPDAEKAAKQAPSVFTLQARNQMKGLDGAQEIALHITENPTRVLAAAGPQVRHELTRIASLSIPNKGAIQMLTEMGKRHAYVNAGSKSGLENLLPGVRVSVLGPPTLSQTAAITRQTKWDDAEFWKLYAKASGASSMNVPSACGRSLLFPQAPTETIARAPSYIKWVIQKLDSLHLQDIRRIVRALDDAMNNTSVILLFEVGEKAFLFPGDAQLENWQFALSDKALRSRLRNAVLYKVGHHGSTNATPKSLWGLFRHRNAKHNRLTTLLSTEKGHHSGVPRESLVKALEDETELHSTQGWKKKLSETYVVGL